jgi:hypothetical protein
MVGVSVCNDYVRTGVVDMQAGGSRRYVQCDIWV